MFSIALFGTSADPPTLGHQAILEWLALHFDRVAVWAADNPFKAKQIPLVHRQAMLQLLVTPMHERHRNVELYPELSHPRSLKTLQQARQKWGSAEFTLVVGSDVVPTLLHWYRVEELLPQVMLLVIPRPGTALSPVVLQRLRQAGAELTVADFEGPQVSSSYYRQTGDSQALPAAVANYIQQRNLYPDLTGEPQSLQPSPESGDVPAGQPATFAVRVDNIIFSVDTDQNCLLVLLNQGQHPSTSMNWSLPGTLVQPEESLEAAAYRNLAEKLHVEKLYLEQLYTVSGPPSEVEATSMGDNLRSLSVSYFALVPYEEAVLNTQEHHGIAWHPLNALPPLVAQHKDMLTYAHRRLCNKLEYSPMAFDVLPETFTLSELYQLYRTVLGAHFSDYSNFRSRLLKLGFLADTGQKVTRGAGRPASLYRFDAEAFAPLKDKPLVFV